MSLSPIELEIHRKTMRPIRSKPFISIAIPSSLTTDGKTLREQTIKIGYIGRAAAIFRVESIMIYIDGRGDAKVVQSILNYLEVPPYLKKSLVPIAPELRFVGLIPPLKTPHHMPPDIFDTPYREGIVVDSDGNRCLIDIGLERKGVAYGDCPRKGTRITAKLVGKGPKYYYLAIVSRADVDIYWGYSIYLFNSLNDLISYAKLNKTLIIVASKKGKPIYEVETKLIEDFKSRDNLLIIFGGPYLDVDEIAQEENIVLDSVVEYVINFVPKQGTVNIRTEEAVIATLSIVNYMKEKTFKSEKDRHES